MLARISQTLEGVQDTIKQIQDNSDKIDQFQKSYNDVMQQMAVKLSASFVNPFKLVNLYSGESKESITITFPRNYQWSNWLALSWNSHRYLSSLGLGFQLQAEFLHLEEIMDFTQKNSSGMENNTNLNNLLPINSFNRIQSLSGSG